MGTLTRLATTGERDAGTGQAHKNLLSLNRLYWVNFETRRCAISPHLQGALRTTFAFILLSGLTIFLLPLTSFMMARFQPRWILGGG